MNGTMKSLLKLLDGGLSVEDGKAKVEDVNKLSKNISSLAEVSALESGERQNTAPLLDPPSRAGLRSNTRFNQRSLPGARAWRSAK